MGSNVNDKSMQIILNLPPTSETLDLIDSFSDERIPVKFYVYSLEHDQDVYPLDKIHYSDLN